jgi:hypothetical protein
MPRSYLSVAGREGALLLSCKAACRPIDAGVASNAPTIHPTKGVVPMLARSRLLLALIPLALAAAVALPGTVLAATVSDTYTIRGAEYYATSTQGRFAGTASGNTGDSATWQATVNHTPLTDTAEITGGTARLATSRLVVVRGEFTGGEVMLVSRQSGCGTETYSVNGDLENVTRSDSSAVGTGEFTATLTHYRASLFGACRTYSATVRGTIELSF